MGISEVIRAARCAEKLSFIEERGLKEQLLTETGRDRVIRMFSVTELGYSPELMYIINTGIYSFIITAFFGGMKDMRNEKTEYLRKNVASTYESEHLARRSLTDKMTLAAVRGGFKTGLKYGSFTTIYFLSSMTVANYRNKISPWEHAVSGAALGSISRCNYGFKGMLVAGGLGGVLGFIAGGIITISMKCTGISMDDLRCWQHEEYYVKLKNKNNRESSAAK